MDIDKMIEGLDEYFENTPKEHFEEVWKNVGKYESYGPDVNDFLGVAATTQRKTSFLKKASAVAL
jgi:hypothetical protein